MTSPLRRYAFINAKLRARISKLIPENTIQQMIRSHSLEEALVILGNTPYGILHEIYHKTGDLKLGELEILKAEIYVYTEIEKYIQDETLELVRSLISFYEIDNLKNVIRIFFDRKIRKRSVETASLYILRDKILHDIAVDAIINAESTEEIVHILETTPYASIVEKFKDSVLQEGSLFLLEIALDHYYYENLIRVAEKLPATDRKESLRLIGVEIDLHNIIWIIRFRRFYNLSIEKVLTLIIPGGYHLGTGLLKQAHESQNVTSVLQGIIKTTYPGLETMLSSQPADSSARLLLIERILERILVYEVQRILRGYPFTIGIIFAYFILKKNEMKKIKAILNAKQYKIPEERIKGLI